MPVSFCVTQEVRRRLALFSNSAASRGTVSSKLQLIISVQSARLGYCFVGVSVSLTATKHDLSSKGPKEVKSGDDATLGAQGTAVATQQ